MDVGEGCDLGACFEC